MRNLKITAPIENERLINAGGVASILGCHERTVRRLVAEGSIPVVKIPGSRLLRFRASTLRELNAVWEGIRAATSPFDDGPGAVAA